MRAASSWNDVLGPGGDRLPSLSTDQSPHADEQKAEKDQSNPQNPRVGARGAESLAEILDLEHTIVREDGHETAQGNEQDGEDKG